MARFRRAALSCIPLHGLTCASLAALRHYLPIPCCQQRADTGSSLQQLPELFTALPATARTLRHWFLLLLVLLQSACIAPPGQETVEVIDLEEPSEGVLSMPERRLESGGGNAVDQLLGLAGSAIDRQQYEQAAALAERAMRINPQDPRAYFALAQVNYYQQRQGLAESLLQKARALAVNDPRLLMSIEAFGQRIAATATLR